jgi:hypothetical protein
MMATDSPPPPYSAPLDDWSLVDGLCLSDYPDTAEQIALPSDNPPSYLDAHPSSSTHNTSEAETSQTGSWSIASIANMAVSSLITVIFRPWERISSQDDLLRHERYNSRQWVDREGNVQIQRYLEANVRD